MKLWNVMPMLALAACGAQPGTHDGLNTGNGLTTAALQLGVSSSATVAATGSAEQPLTQAPMGVDAQGTTFTLTSASVAVLRIDMELPSAGAFSNAQRAGVSANVSLSPNDVAVNGPFEVDLIQQTTKPILGQVVVPSGAYARVRVRIAPFTGDDLEHAFEATGSLVYRGQPTPFTLAIDFNEDALFTAPGGFQLQSDRAAQVALRLDVAKWFTEVPITACLDSGDLELEQGTLHIKNGTGQCSDLESMIKDAVEDSGEVTATP